MVSRTFMTTVQTDQWWPIIWHSVHLPHQCQVRIINWDSPVLWTEWMPMTDLVLHRALDELTICCTWFWPRGPSNFHVQYSHDAQQILSND